MESITLDKQQFRLACAKYTTGITVTAVLGQDGCPHGLTANSFTSVSLEPPLVLVCIDMRARILQHFLENPYFGISVLTEEQREVSRCFASNRQDRFGAVEWFQGTRGVPLIEGALSTFECARKQTVEAGDHMILIGEVLSVG
ncbi:MAG: flavin reductase family protein, partial [Acidobacteriales bacterium]|nr:flavin reductase family protein [Terriglobales bacterium]